MTAACRAPPRLAPPQVDRHKVHPTWHASGRFMVVQGEMGGNVLSGDRSKLASELFINGMWMNLYAVTPDGQQWHRLTDYIAIGANGAMMPYFSADGSKLLWSRLVRAASAWEPWGAYRLMLADFVIDSSGKPSLQNIRGPHPIVGRQLLRVARVFPRWESSHLRLRSGSARQVGDGDLDDGPRQ